jgi:hypothetical protein
MIFQSELTNLDSELSQLQALLSAKQQQRNLYNQLQQQTEGYLVGLAKLKDQIAETVGGGALASLKSAVLNLFDPGDHGEFGGNQPTAPTPDDGPAPEADQEDDDFDIIALNGETGDCLTTDDLGDIDDAGTAKLTYAQAIKRRCGACWGYEVTSKGDIKAGFVNRANLNFMEAVNLERSGREFYETVEAYLDRLYYNGQTCQLASFLELDKPLVAGSRFWFGGKDNTGTVIRGLKGEYLCQIDGAVGEVELERRYLHYVSTTLEGQACDIDKAPKTGQKCFWASPFASPLCSVIWEDAPLNGQYCTITPSATEDNGYKSTSEGERMPYVELVRHPENSAIAYQRKHDGEIICVYVGFRTKAIAQSWMRFFEVLAGDCQLRESKRLKSKHLGDFRWEIKAKGVSMAQINRLASEEDLNKSYRPEVGSATKLPAKEPAQAAEIAVGSSIRVLSWQGHDCDKSSDIATVKEIEDGMYRIDVKNSQGINIWLSRKAITPLSTEADQTPAQQLGIEPPAGWRQVQAQAEPLTTMPTKKARITLESSPWKGQDCEVLEVTPDGRWWKLRLPNGQELKYPGDTIEPVEEKVAQPNEKIEFNDLVEVVDDGNDCVGLVGSFGRVKVIGETRIGVEIDEQLVYFNPLELRIKAKEEKAPQRQGLQAGQLLMGDRVITSGNYIGEGRVSQLLSAKLGTADKIATIQLAKDLKNLGFDPRLAATVMAGEDDASDF